jgi:hypothetical protein
VASCAMPAGPGMNIKTDTPLVKKAREGVMEFLLVSALASHRDLHRMHTFGEDVYGRLQGVCRSHALVGYAHRGHFK